MLPAFLVREMEECRVCRFVCLDGRLLIEPLSFDNLYEFNGDYAIVQQGQKWGLIERSGRFVLPTRYDAFLGRHDDLFHDLGLLQQSTIGEQAARSLLDLVLERQRCDHVQMMQDVFERNTHVHRPQASDAEVTIDTFFERLHPDDRAPTRAAIDQSIETGAPFDIDFRTITADGGCVVEPARATSLYHIVGAVSALSRASPHQRPAKNAQGCDKVQ
jgi:hypothetical protein